MSRKLRKKNNSFKIAVLVGLCAVMLSQTGCEGDWEKNLPFEPIHIQVTMTPPSDSSSDAAQPAAEGSLPQEPEVQDLQPQPEMQWLTYTNQANKYLIKYPESWTVTEGSGGAIYIKAPGREDIKFQIIPSVSSEINPTIEKLASRRESERKAAFSDLVNVRVDSLAVGGGHALRKTWEYTESNKEIAFSGKVRETAVFFLKDNQEYTIYATAPKQIIGGAEVYFVGMIQSFQFL